MNFKNVLPNSAKFFAMLQSDRFSLVYFLLLYLIGVACIVGENSLSPTYQEFPHLVAGVIGLKRYDFRIFNVNPPLPQLVAALSASLKSTRSLHVPQKYFGHRIEHDVVDTNVYQSKLYDFNDLRNARLLSSILFLTAISFAFYQYATTINFSPCFVLILWVSSPYILAFAPIVGPDVPSAAVGLLAVYFFWRWLNKPEMLAAFIAGIILGFAELSKFTLLIFYPLFVLIWLIYRLPELRTLSKRDFVAQIGQLVLLFAMSILIINMGYLFEDTGRKLGKFKFQTTLFTGCENLKDVPPIGGNRFENSLLGKIPVPLPANFIQGIDTQRFDFEFGLPSYLRGEWSEHGWWYYYLYALLLKLPLGVILLFGVAIFCTLFVREVNAGWRDEMVLILPGVVLLIFVSSQTGFSIHSRYVIPALPFFFIWISKVGKLFSPQVPRSFKKRVLSIIISILLAWSVVSSLSIYPHSISYFNELAAIIPTPREPRCPSEPCDSSFIVSIIGAGSRNGGRHLHDSNIDWGQDIFYLEKWCNNHPEVTSINVFCFSSFPLDQTTIPLNKNHSEVDKLTGYIALSTNNLYDKENQFHRFLDTQPIARIGYSIYIYRIEDEQH